MVVEIMSHDPDPMDKICALTHICYPHIKTDTLSLNEKKRLVRKLIRQKDIILQSVHVLFHIKCPIFVYNDIMIFSNKIKFKNVSFDFEDLTFEPPANFNDIHLGQLGLLFKKVKSVLKTLKTDNISDNDLLYILPMSTMVSFNAYLDFLEIYDFITCIKNSKVHEKTKELSNEMFNVMNHDFSDFFNQQTLDIFLANKEK